MRVLILYYSFTGNTKHVSRLVADVLNAEIAEFTCTAYSYGFFGSLRQAWDVLIGGTPPIEIPDKVKSGYDLVIAAGPVWGARPAPPMRSFVKQCSKLPGKLAFMLTCGGTSQKYPGEKALVEIVALATNPPIATHLFKMEGTEQIALSQDINNFADQVRQALAKT